MKDIENRFVFYPYPDGASWEKRERVEIILNNFDNNTMFSINDIIELYQIKLKLDEGRFPGVWTDQIKIKYQNTVKHFWSTISKFFININDNNFIDFYNELGWNYFESFWTLINNLKVYKHIKPETFTQIIEKDDFYLEQVLVEENIVNYYSDVIKASLMARSDSAKILLSHFEENKKYDIRNIYFPKILTAQDKEIIVINYLNSENPNLNYVRLIEKARNIKLSDKTKLKAKKLSISLNDNLFREGVVVSRSVSVTIDGKQEEPLKHIYNSETNEMTYSYGVKWLIGDKLQIFFNFQRMFHYLNKQGCIELVSKEIEIDSLEDTLMRHQNEYFVYVKFFEKDSLSKLQLFLYEKFLKDKGIDLENVLSYIVNEFLNNNYIIERLKISFPSEGTSPLEKIRTLAPELEFLLKQYRSYVEEDNIDFELLQISTNQLNFGEVKSKSNKKYAYGTGNEFTRIKNDFYSSNSFLHYIEPYESKYRNLTQLLLKENVSYEAFKEYQKPEIDYLLSKKYITINELGFIKINNLPAIIALSTLHKEEVISFWHQPEFIRNEILSLEKQGLIIFENTLFTRAERQYLNYHLNQKEFTNGLDLRNKYLHGTNPHSTEEQQDDYYTMLKILILVILKIEDDLSINEITKK